MTNEEFYNAHIGERVLYKGKDIGAYVAGYLEDKYIILGFDNFDGCISAFTPRVCTYVKIYNSYRFAKLKYLEVVNISNMEKEERCCGNCLWFIDEDCLGDGWCNENDCETSCDKVCKKHEF